MAKMLLLGAEPATIAAVEAALSAAGHGVMARTSAAEIREELRRQSYALLFIADGGADFPGVDIAVEAEERGVRAVIMTKSARRLDELRAKGLICFEQPESPEALATAIQTRL
jgi:DNA-binding response OmpR family regulator